MNIFNRGRSRMNYSRDHARPGRRGHADEITIAACGHAMNIEPCQAPCAAAEKNEADQPAELNQTNAFGNFGIRERFYSPGIRKNCGRNAEADDVRKRIKFFAEIAGGSHRACNASVQRVKKNSDADGARCVIKLRGGAFERRKDGVVAAEQIGNSEKTGKNVHAATESGVAEKLPFAGFGTDGI